MLTLIYVIQGCADGLSPTLSSEISPKGVTSEETYFNSLHASTESYAQIQNINGVLHFKNANHFKEVMESLEAEIYIAEETLEQFSETSSDQMEEGYHDYPPLLAFESQLQFKSRRAFVEEAENKWMSSPPLDWDENPDDWDGYDPILRTLMSPDGKVFFDGEEYTFNFKNQRQEGAKIFDCYIYAWDQEWSDYPAPGGFATWRARTKVSLVNGAGFTVASGETKNYRLTSGGGTIKQKTKMRALVGGSFYTTSCNFHQQDKKWNNGFKKKSSRTVKITKFLSSNFSANKDEPDDIWEAVGEFENGSVVVTADLD